MWIPVLDSISRISPGLDCKIGLITADSTTREWPRILKSYERPRFDRRIWLITTQLPEPLTQYMEKLSESKRLKNRARIPAALTPRIPDYAKMDPFLFTWKSCSWCPDPSRIHSQYFLIFRVPHAQVPSSHLNTTVSKSFTFVRLKSGPRDGDGNKKLWI
jgi:hypothetical protein